MFKFFRNIRQSLLMENKTSKYFKYAIGEIILVVIGILIALQINNWNENRKQYLAEIEFLKGIKNDLIQDSIYIDLIIRTIEPKLNAFNSLNKRISNYTEGNDIGKDSLFHTYLFVGQRTFYPVSGSFQSAIAGNAINTFEHKDITGLIIKLYNSIYPRLIDNASILDQRWDLLTQQYLEERRTKQIVITTQDKAKKVINDMYYHYLQLNWYHEVLENTKEHISITLQKIDD